MMHPLGESDHFSDATLNFKTGSGLRPDSDVIFHDMQTMNPSLQNIQQRFDIVTNIA
jgi:hypothetical protein